MEINNFLIESALLTHGLASIGGQTMGQMWPASLNNIAWLDQGRIAIGGMAEFLPFRSQWRTLRRVDCQQLGQAQTQGLSGALTASGTMAVCQGLGLPLAVTSGMGCVGDVPGEELCPDLPALAELPVALVATSPKDMLDINATVQWLRDHGVTVLGRDEPCCTGYLFLSARVELDGCLPAGAERPLTPGQLLLNPIPETNRLQDLSLLAQGVAAGKAAKQRGGYFHPAVNGELDRLTKGYSSLIQFRSLIANGELAAKLV